MRMSKMKKIIVGNWKMNPSDLLVAKKLFLSIKRTASQLKKVKVVVCPPFVFVSDLKKLSGDCVLIGAQDLFYEEGGAFTGEISPSMLKSAGVSYAIVGHSERRNLGETDEIINRKILAGLRGGLKIILCIGEKLRDESGDYLNFIRGQMATDLKGVSKKLLKNLIIAYEPIWAIGKDAPRAASPDDVIEISIFIRRILAQMFGRDIAMSVEILYGGSVDDNNSNDFLKDSGVSGLLVGRASLDSDVFNKILENAKNV